MGIRCKQNISNKYLQNSLLCQFIHQPGLCLSYIMDPQEKKIFEAVLIACLLMGSIFIYVFKSLLRQYKRNLFLRKQNSIAAVSAMEQDRSRIATDIHDDITPSLALAKIELTQIQPKNGDNEFKKQSVALIIDETLARIREISFDLMPTILLRKGLMAGIRQMVKTVKDGHAINIAFIGLENTEFPAQQAINIFRIVQESLHNTIKHSKADAMIIDFDKKNDLVILKIADNGIGLNYDEQLEKYTGFGLRSIRNRIENLGGQMFVESKTGKGLSYIFEIPLKEQVIAREKIP